jgi:hypothetical protein
MVANIMPLDSYRRTVKLVATWSQLYYRAIIMECYYLLGYGMMTMMLYPLLVGVQ